MKIDCPKCKGSKVMQDADGSYVNCDKCEGTGSIVKPADDSGPTPGPGGDTGN